VNTQPEQGADVFIDNIKRGQSPLTVDKLPSGEHAIRVMKVLYFPTTQTATVSDGQTATLNITMKSNFAALTFKADGDIYVNDERKATGTWSDRLSPGLYKVEVRKASHRSTVTTVEAKAGETRTVDLDAPAPMYGSLDLKANVYAAIFVDNVKQNSTPFLISRLLVGKHEVRLQADGYHPYTQTVEVAEGKMAIVNATLQEKPKTTTLKIAANVSASVEVNGEYVGSTPKTVPNLPLGEAKVTFSANDYKTLNKTIYLLPENNEIYGTLKPIVKPKSKFFMEYVYSRTAPLGLSLGYCKRWGGYMQVRTSTDFGAYSVEPGIFSTIDFSKKSYSRLALTAGAMARIFNGCYLYAGVGYGSYGAAYLVDNSSYYCPSLQKGVEAEGGVRILLWNLLSLSAGYNTMFSSGSQRFADVHFGVGFGFGKK
jgi:hypothetical protein